jgi:hypothetical protein
MTLAAEHDIAPIFGIFFAFWAVVLLALWFGVGYLVHKHDRMVQKRKSHGDGH